MVKLCIQESRRKLESESSFGLCRSASSTEECLYFSNFSLGTYLGIFAMSGCAEGTLVSTSQGTVTMAGILVLQKGSMSQLVSNIDMSKAVKESSWALRAYRIAVFFENC